MGIAVAASNINKGHLEHFMVRITPLLLLAPKAKRCPLTRMEAREGVTTNMGTSLGAVIIDTVEVDNILKCQQLMSTEDKGFISLEPSNAPKARLVSKKKKKKPNMFSKKRSKK